MSIIKAGTYKFNYNLTNWTGNSVIRFACPFTSVYTYELTFDSADNVETYDEAVITLGEPTTLDGFYFTYGSEGDTFGYYVTDAAFSSGYNPVFYYYYDKSTHFGDDKVESLRAEGTPTIQTDKLRGLGQTITITSDTEVDDTFGAWFSENTVPVAITDLTGTTWYIPSGWTATKGYGIYSVDFILDGYTSCNLLSIGYGLFSTSTNSIKFGLAEGGDTFLDSSSVMTLTFTGGTDVTNPALIAWLQENSETKVTEVQTIKAGTYRFNDELTTFTQTGGSHFFPLKFTATANFTIDTDNKQLNEGSQIFEFDDFRFIVTVSQGITAYNVGYNPILFDTAVYNQFTGSYAGNSQYWNTYSMGLYNKGYKNTDLAKGFGQTITIIADTEVDETFADWFEDNTEPVAEPDIPEDPEEPEVPEETAIIKAGTYRFNDVLTEDIFLFDDYSILFSVAFPFTCIWNDDLSTYILSEGEQTTFFDTISVNAILGGVASIYYNYSSWDYNSGLMGNGEIPIYLHFADNPWNGFAHYLVDDWGVDESDVEASSFDGFGQTITVTEDAEVPAEFATWFEANTEPVEEKITDLTGTTWTIPAGWIAPGYVSTMDAHYKYYITGSITYGGNTHEGLIYFRASNSSYLYFLFEGKSFYLQNTNDVTFNITGGEDATNPDLIAWFESGGTIRCTKTLKGVWRFKESINFPNESNTGGYTDLSHNLDFINRAFTFNGSTQPGGPESYSTMEIHSGRLTIYYTERHHDGLEWLHSTYTVYDGSGTGWYSDENRYVALLYEQDVTNEFYNWFTSNADDVTSSFSLIHYMDKLIGMVEDGHSCYLDVKNLLMNTDVTISVPETKLLVVSPAPDSTTPTLKGVWRFKENITATKSIYLPVILKVVGYDHSQWIYVDYVYIDASYDGSMALSWEMLASDKDLREHRTCYTSSNGWTNDSDRYIYFPTEQSVDEYFYQWFISNAENITDCATYIKYADEVIGVLLGGMTARLPCKDLAMTSVIRITAPKATTT